MSRNERQRLSREFDKLQEALTRQKDGINRLTLLNIEATAALFQIAEDTEMAAEAMREKARDTLGRLAKMSQAGAAAIRDQEAELPEETNEEDDADER